MSYGLKDAYNVYKEHSPSPVERNVYENIFYRFITEMTEDILRGGYLYMGNDLSIIRIRKINRNFNKPQINWKETNILFAQGIRSYVYYTDDTYYRYYWWKARCKIKNKMPYKFTPTRGDKGLVEKLKHLLHTDEIAYLNFKYENDL